MFHATIPDAPAAVHSYAEQTEAVHAYRPDHSQRAFSFEPLTEADIAAKIDARARGWATPELMAHVERYAHWAAVREWGEFEDLFSISLRATWRSLLYAAQKEHEGVYHFDDADSIRRWVMASVRRHMEWKRNKGQTLKAINAPRTGRRHDLGRFAVYWPKAETVEGSDRAEFWHRVRQNAFSPNQRENVERVLIGGENARDVARSRGTAHQAVYQQLRKTKERLVEALAEFVA